MHALSLSTAWHHWRDRHPSAAVHAAQAVPPRVSASVADDPERLPRRTVRWLPLAIPGMALLMLLCASLIGSILR